MTAFPWFEQACLCSRHNIAAARRMATAENAGFGMRLPDWVTTCTEPDRATSPDVIAFWREVHT